MRAAYHEPTPGSDPIRERIIQTATRLFTSLGYDGTSTQLIADSAGLDLATVTDRAGGKRDIYLAVMEKAHLTEREMLEAAAAEFTPDRAGVHRLLDSCLDFYADNPEIPWLWMHRRQADATDITGLENLYLMPALGLIKEMLHKAVDTDVDLDYALWTIIWCIDGFCVGGVLDRNGRRKGPHDFRYLERFRTHLRQLVDRMLELDR
ncbi:MAG: TetR family transcriptional regulator [Actinomycetia bacterium]|nr:TetR family transcriptional regulator [Actinomycetes bacterium]